MTSGIYDIFNNVNGHRYIGSAINMAGRWYKHRHELRKGTHHSAHLQNAWNKYGESAFSFRQLFYCDIEMLITFEQRAMDVIKPEYNISSLAINPMLGRQHSASTKAKMSLALKGRKITPEARANMSAAQMGSRKTSETRAKMSATHKKNKTHKGRKLSPETRAKISAAHTGRKATLKTRSKMSATHMGHEVSQKTREKISTALKSFYEDPLECEKISTAMKGNKNSLGHKHSLETRAIMSAIKRGKHKEE